MVGSGRRQDLRAGVKCLPLGRELLRLLGMPFRRSSTATTEAAAETAKA